MLPQSHLTLRLGLESASGWSATREPDERTLFLKPVGTCSNGFDTWHRMQRRDLTNGRSHEHTCLHE